MPRIGFREAVGVKIAIAILRDLISISRERCIDVKRLEWLLDELEAYANHIVREEIGIHALELGKYIASEILNTEQRKPQTRC